MTTISKKCRFCHLPEDRIWVETDTALVFLDPFPVAEGHALVIPKRHVSILSDLPAHELMEIWFLVDRIRQMLRESVKPDRFDIDVSQGVLDGHIIDHAHVHIIPRNDGKAIDAPSGIRKIARQKSKPGPRPRNSNSGSQAEQ